MTLFPSGESFTRAGIDRAGKLFAETDSNVKDVQMYRAFRMQCVGTSLGILERAKLPERICAGVRLKRLDSIRRKLIRKNQNFKLSELDDIIGIRVICASFAEMKAVSESVANLPEVVRTKNYTEKEHYVQTGYRAVHHIAKFSQEISPGKKINVRFEIQVRSYYQHLWAVWSESFGENIKSLADVHQTEEGQKIIADLLAVSQQVADWEQSHPTKKQDGGKLPLYRGEKILTAVRQQDDGGILRLVFHDTSSAVRQLENWENTYPHKRHNALLLAGIADKEEIIKVLAATHPLYVLGRVYPPEIWLP